MPSEYLATCECGTQHRASAHRLEAIGPDCDKCHGEKHRKVEDEHEIKRKAKEAAAK